MSRDTALEHLHPLFRERVCGLAERLRSTPLRLFEGYRSAQRQQQLYARGRTMAGPKVTHACAWQSYHQYGLAADFVLFIDGKWSWESRGELGDYWRELHSSARMLGLEWLSWEAPHVQLGGLSVRGLKAGQYPDGGDASWAENLQTDIQAWGRASEAPPAPVEAPARPGLPSGHVSAGDEATDRAPPARYRVIARTGLYVRAGPGTHWGAVGKLEPDQEVTLMAIDGEWFLIDSGHDGHADGYCYGGYVRQVE